jgi:cobalt-zinc-cadmium efflux system membrane fusion protein
MRGWLALLPALLLMASPVAAQPAADAAVIQVDERVEARLRTAAVAPAKLQRKVRVPATVELDPARVSRIDAGADGRMLAVDVDTGQKVSAGQVLAWVTSPDVTRAQVALLGAVAEVDIQRRAVQRASELVQAEVIAQAELERRQKELFLAAMAVQSHRDQLALLGMSEREIEQVVRTESIHSEIAVVSETDGVLIERNVDRGQVVRTGEPVFVVADLSRVRVEGRAPEREVPFLARAREVHVEIPAVNQMGRIGDELFVGATVNPATRTVTVRTALDSRTAGGAAGRVGLGGGARRRHRSRLRARGRGALPLRPRRPGTRGRRAAGRGGGAERGRRGRGRRRLPAQRRAKAPPGPIGA